MYDDEPFEHDVHEHPDMFPEGTVTPEQLEEQSKLLKDVPGHVVEYCEFRDQPPGGRLASRTTEVTTSEGSFHRRGREPDRRGRARGARRGTR